jgi:predicted NBD/HSP70 family sugar kinase
VVSAPSASSWVRTGFVPSHHPRCAGLERHEVGVTEPTRPAVAAAVEKMLSSFAGIEQVGATGVAFPGRVETDGLVTASVTLGDWRGHRVPEVLVDVVPGAVVAGNDITALTSAETQAQFRAGERHAMVIHLGRRPTIGVIVDGSRYSGAHGQAGDLSRLQLPTITSLVGDDFDAESRLHVLLAAAAIGEGDAVATLTAYTDDVFGALINAIAVVDPALVVVAGPLQRVAVRFLPGWSRRAVRCLQDPPRFVAGSFDEYGIATGAALIAAEHLDRHLTESR